MIDTRTVVLRYATASALKQAAPGVLSCVGGYGPVLESIEAALDNLRNQRTARVPAEWEAEIRERMGSEGN